MKDNNGLVLHQVHFPLTAYKKGNRGTVTCVCKLCKESKGAKHYYLTCDKGTVTCVRKLCKECKGAKHLICYYYLTCDESNAFVVPIVIMLIVMT